MKLCFLWHQHQPDYRRGNGFFLPWVRMHATKDYLDLPLLLFEYPVKHTINVVPSLLVQIDAYLAGAQDPVQRLCSKPVSHLSQEECLDLARWITTLQRETQVRSLPALDAVWDRLVGGLARFADHGMAIALTAQEWLDAQVLLHIAWTGPLSRKRPMARTLLQQGHGFSEQQRDALLAEHLEILDQVVPTMARGEADGLFEISVTPYHHPILPLLINSNVAVECMPQAPLPQPPITEAADAEWHVLTALNDWEARSGRRPRGMWPAEGSVSMEALGLMAAAGLHWTATDEAVLRNSLGDRYTEASPYLPYRVQTSSGAMSMLFRDHGLSDAIGFTYATWDAEDAVNDFVQRLADRRERILQSLPEDLHANAVIPVMLDGENCWEFYHGNGEAFLRRLLEVLAVDSRFQSVTASEATASVTGDVGGDSHQMLEKVVAGSWINGTFDVWIGTPTKNLAWSLLRAARNAVRHVGDPDHLLALVRSLEASDYFWWYDERHVAPHKGEFDAAFRSSLAGIFTACNIEPPCNLDLTMQELTMEKESTEREYPVSFAQSTMHEADAITKSLTLETDDNWQRISFHLYRVPDGSEEVIYTITDRHGVERRFGLTEGELLFQTPIHDEGFEHKTDTHLCAYLHTSMVWVVSVEEQRASGRVARTALTLAL